jgi:NAD(P)-dependent dehydrogenase (short-subunit alcohol dehydrogenase family)
LLAKEIVMTHSSTPQAPLPSGFGPQTTAREVLAAHRLDGTTAIVTGGYAGVGLETTRVLVGAGASVIVPARSREKARAATADLAGVTLEALDLADPASVAAFARRFVASDRPLHLLINNAGIMATPLSRDARGFESQFATNHLGHFELTVRLWPALQKARGARVVALSSRGHARASVDLDDPNFQCRPYDKWLAYGRAKTANALFALALDRRGQSEGVRAFSVHPGAILTELTRSMDEEERRATIERARQLTPLKTVEQGASTSVWCATSPQLAGKGGVYCEDTDIAQAVPADHAGGTGVRPWAMDADLAERLWQKSEQWTGVRFG